MKPLVAETGAGAEFWAGSAAQVVTAPAQSSPVMRVEVINFLIVSLVFMVI
jgi:hypothetical protein